MQHKHKVTCTPVWEHSSQEEGLEGGDGRGRGRQVPVLEAAACCGGVDKLPRRPGAGLGCRVGEESGLLGANLKLNGRRSQTSWLRQLLPAWGNLSPGPQGGEFFPGLCLAYGLWQP